MKTNEKELSSKTDKRYFYIYSSDLVENRYFCFLLQAPCVVISGNWHPLLWESAIPMYKKQSPGLVTPLLTPMEVVQVYKLFELDPGLLEKLGFECIEIEFEKEREEDEPVKSIKSIKPANRQLRSATRSKPGESRATTTTSRNARAL